MEPTSTTSHSNVTETTTPWAAANSGNGFAFSLPATIRLIRVRQWVKNLFLFIPTFFAGHLFRVHEMLTVAYGALAFSLVASAVYVVNDIRDRHVDRLHPTKRFRPIASGEIGTISARILVVFLTTAGLLLSASLNISFLYLLTAYLLMNLAYSFGLKHVPILDLFIVSIGFLMRVYSGGVIAGLPVTNWLSIMILLLALFLIIAKRRDDLLINAKSGSVIRKSTEAYNLDFINSCITLVSAVTIVAYIMYTMSPAVTERFQSDYLFITTIFVIAGMMRYLQIIFVENRSGSPSRIFVKDKFILATIAGWIICFYLIIYVT